MGGDKTPRWEIIDGQQRILALAGFMKGNFSLLDPGDKKLKIPKSLRDIEE